MGGAAPAPVARIPEGPDAAGRFLAALGDPDAIVPAEGVALVVAHPDDETIGAGAQLPRLPGLLIVHVTDGAPGGAAATEHGFASVADYAAARRRELEAAMALAGVPREALVALGIPDQGTAHALPVVARRLAALLDERGIRVVLTHAYEGGHPDHDATAFAVHAAARLLGGRGSGVIEMPFYHAGPQDWVVGAFPPGPSAPETVLCLDPGRRRLKRAMLDAHASQARVLSRMPLEAERFRLSPAYDFRTQPNGGRLLYERHGWGLTGAQWQERAEAALRELRLDDPGREGGA